MYWRVHLQGAGRYSNKLTQCKTRVRIQAQEEKILVHLDMIFLSATIFNFFFVARFWASVFAYHVYVVLQTSEQKWSFKGTSGRAKKRPNPNANPKCDIRAIMN